MALIVNYQHVHSNRIDDIPLAHALHAVVQGLELALEDAMKVWEGSDGVFGDCRSLILTECNIFTTLVIHFKTDF